MPLFPQDEIDAAQRREADRDASLHATTAQELRSWLACQDDVAEASIPRRGRTAARGQRLLMSVTVSTLDEPPALCGAEAAQGMTVTEWGQAADGLLFLLWIKEGAMPSVLGLMEQREAALAGNPIHAGHAPCWYSCRMPPSRSCRRMSRRVIFSGSAMGAGSGRSGAAFAMP